MPSSISRRIAGRGSSRMRRARIRKALPGSANPTAQPAQLLERATTPGPIFDPGTQVRGFGLLDRRGGPPRSSPFPVAKFGKAYSSSLCVTPPRPRRFFCVLERLWPPIRAMTASINTRGRCEWAARAGPAERRRQDVRQGCPQCVKSTCQYIFQGAVYG